MKSAAAFDLGTSQFCSDGKSEQAAEPEGEKRSPWRLPYPDHVRGRRAITFGCGTAPGRLMADVEIVPPDEQAFGVS